MQPPECLPLRTVEELLAWSPGQDEHCRAAVPLRPHPATDAAANAADAPAAAPPARQRLLAVHDMRGNYLDDRFPQGGTDAALYAFTHWRRVDAFCYFAHELVTVPPPGWIVAGHAAGVPVLGALVAEHAAGAAAAAALFRAPAAAERAAEQLAALAARRGFDGWLVNLECAVAPGLVPNVVLFLRALTERMRRAPAAGRSLVIWYDAVTVDGKLQYQNELNGRNRPFFDACDGIFLNYKWGQGVPAAAAAAAGPRRAGDVFMGIDCHGRGTFGGGKLSCDVALRAARAAGVSAALFAVAWPFEDGADGADGEREEEVDSGAPRPPQQPSAPGWERRDALFWARASAAWPPPRRAAAAALPFHSDFCVGRGPRLARRGALLSGAPWFNVALQAPQPALEPLPPAAALPPGLEAGVTAEHAWSGGGCLRLAGGLDRPLALRLFSLAAPVPPAGLRLAVAASASAGVRVAIDVALSAPAAGRGAAPPVVLRLVADAAALSAPLAAPPGGAAVPRAPSRSRRARLLPPAAAGGDGADGGGGAPRLAPAVERLRRGDLLSVEQPDWEFREYTVPGAELAAAGVASGWVVAGVDLVVEPRVAGSTCRCSVLVGEVGVAALGGGRGAAAGVGGLACDALRQRAAPGGGVELAAALRWVPPPGGGHVAHVWCSWEAGAGAGAVGERLRPLEGAPAWLGVAAAPAFVVGWTPVPPGAVAVRLLVQAVGADGEAQALASAAALRLPLVA